MDPKTQVLLRSASTALPLAGDRLVGMVHRAVTGKDLKGDPAKAVDALVDQGGLTPEAALYLSSFRKALYSLGEAVRP